MGNLQSWLRQPSTITGLAIFGSMISAALTHALTGDMAITGVVGAAVLGGMHVAMPDNTAAAAAMVTLADDVVAAATDRHLAEKLPTLLSDAVAVASTLKAPAVSSNAAGQTNAPSGSSASTNLAGGILLAIGLAGSLAACTGSPAETQAAAEALTCALDGSGGVVAVAVAPGDPGSKALAASISAGSTLVTDEKCRQAVKDGTAILINKVNRAPAAASPAAPPVATGGGEAPSGTPPLPAAPAAVSVPAKS